MLYQDKKNYYHELIDTDILERIRILLEKNGYYLSDDNNKITAELHQNWNTPWHHVCDDGQSDCHLWHSVIFDVLGFIPSGCMNCFKVVIRPKTLKQLFALLDLQLSLGYPSKCGIEIRQFVRGLYGGYFYNKGFQEGIDKYKIVKKAISEDPVLSPLLQDVDASGLPKRVVLKRACTEMEAKFGRSDQWTMTEEDYKTEQLLTSLFNKKGPAEQPKYVIDHIHANWIKFAWKYDPYDETIDEYTGGIPLFRPTVTYHNLVEMQEERE